jgi:hypothetical protein
MVTRRVLLLPNQASGSVEHFYHFLFGYLCPMVLWIERSGATRVTVRDCGPMTPWFDVLPPGVDVDVVAPGVMLQRVVGRHQPMKVLESMDNPMLFDRRAFRLFAKTVAGPPSDHSGPASAQVLVTDRGRPDPFYTGPLSQNPTAGNDRRSVPNMAEVTHALEAGNPARLIDAATMSPRDQIQSFSSACAVVGQHGAGLANMVWMPAGSTVIEILPPVRDDVRELFRDLADTLGHSYGRVDQESLHSDVNPADVLEALRSAPPPRVLGPTETARRRLLRAGKSTEVRLRRSSTLRWTVRLVR